MILSLLDVVTNINITPKGPSMYQYALNPCRNVE